MKKVMNSSGVQSSLGSLFSLRYYVKKLLFKDRLVFSSLKYISISIVFG